MDSGGFQHFLNGKPAVGQKEVFEVQVMCKPDYASSLDFPTDSSERVGGIIYKGKKQELTKDEKDERVELTIENANKFKDLFLKKAPNFIPIGVIQGYDENSYKYCALQLKSIDFPYYAVGSCFRAPKLEVVKRVKWVREIIPDKPLHVFGIGSILLMKILQKEYKVQSVDTASHIVAAGYGNIFINGKQKWGRKVQGKLRTWAKRRGNKAKYQLALFNAGQIEFYVTGKPNIFVKRIVNYIK
jgi:tRNA-guanine family transglycosylase